MVLRTVLIPVEHTRVFINIAGWNFRNRSAVECLHILILSKNFLTCERLVLQLHFIDKSAEHIVGEQACELYGIIIFTDQQACC
ncbi:hypothetical protein D3C75_456440 [compost metagenome]